MLKFMFIVNILKRLRVIFRVVNGILCLLEGPYQCNVVSEAENMGVCKALRNIIYSDKI